MNRLLILVAAAIATPLAAAFSARSLSEPAAEPAVETPVAAVAETASAPFAGGERLLYDVTYRAALIPPINILRVSLTTIDESAGGRDLYHVVGQGTTVGGARTLFDIDDTYHSWLDRATIRPNRTASHIRENDYRLSSTCAYDWDSRRANTRVHRPGHGAGGSASFDLPAGYCGDALSLLYSLRAADLSTLTAGTNRLWLVFAESVKPIECTFEGRETVKVRRLGTFRAMRFSCTMATSDGSTYEDDMRLTVWLSDDESRVPLMVESPVRVGRVSITLAEGYRTAHRLTCRVE